MNLINFFADWKKKTFCSNMLLSFWNDNFSLYFIGGQFFFIKFDPCLFLAGYFSISFWHASALLALHHFQARKEMGLKCGTRLAKGIKCGQCPSDHKTFSLSVSVDLKSSLQAGGLERFFGNSHRLFEGVLHISSGVSKCMVLPKSCAFLLISCFDA